MTRTRMALIVPVLGLTGALALTGCGAAAPGAAANVAADVADEAVALQQVGFGTGLEEAPSPAASADAKTGDHQLRRKAIRKYLRKNTLHGEVAVQTKDGVQTVVVQRGSVTAVTATGVTVKSTDGFSLSWTFGDKLTVVQDKKVAEKSALRTGEQVGVAGIKDGAASDARLIAVK